MGRNEKINLKLPAVLYNIIVYKTGLNDTDIISIENCLWRYKKKYPHVSFFIAISNHVGRGVQKKSIKTGKRGRPPIIIKGKLKPRHVHIGIIGTENNSAYKYAHEVKNAIDKRFKCKITKVVPKGNSANAINLISYGKTEIK